VLAIWNNVTFLRFERPRVLSAYDNIGIVREKIHGAKDEHNLVGQDWGHETSKLGSLRRSRIPHRESSLLRDRAFDRLRL